MNETRSLTEILVDDIFHKTGLETQDARRLYKAQVALKALENAEEQMIPHLVEVNLSSFETYVVAKNEALEKLLEVMPSEFVPHKLEKRYGELPIPAQS